MNLVFQNHVQRKIRNETNLQSAYLPADLGLFTSAREGVGDLIFDAFLEGDGDVFLDPGRKFFLELLGEAALFGGEGLRSFLESFFDALGDTKRNNLPRR